VTIAVAVFTWPHSQTNKHTHWHTRPKTILAGYYWANKTRSVAVGFGRHGMPLSASNDTDTALGQDGSDWSRDLATLIFDLGLGGHGACGRCGSSSSIRVPSLKFVCFAVRKIWCTMCISINRPSDLDLWLFDLETGLRVASKVGKLCSKFGHARPLGSRIIRYVRDGRTDGRTKATLIAAFPTGGGLISGNRLISVTVTERPVRLGCHGNKGRKTSCIVVVSSVHILLTPVHWAYPTPTVLSINRRWTRDGYRLITRLASVRTSHPRSICDLRSISSILLICNEWERGEGRLCDIVLSR